jgi:hypothetical protein
MHPNPASTQAGDGPANRGGIGSAGGRSPAPAPRRLLGLGLSLFGLVSLAYLLGAAVMFFELPSSSFLHRAFVGGLAWYERSQEAPPDDQLPPLSVGKIDRPDKTCDGFTLLLYGGGNRAVLVNMRGQTVRRWHVPFSQLWPDQPDVDPKNDAGVYYADAHLYPNGDLLVVMEGPADWRNPTSGYGLAKLDKDSHVLWKYRGACHHGLDVAEDGTVYAICSEVRERMPPGLGYIPTPCIVDLVDVISPEGRRLKRIPVLEAFRDSPYAPLLCMLERSKMYGQASPPAPPGVATTPPFVDEARRRDVLHLNAVKVLSRALAPKFPLFKPGQLLLSPRNLDAVAVLDPDGGQVVWAARGPWRAQHDPEFLGNGRLLLFDNMGSPHGSRVLEYDLQTQAFPWSYPGEKGTPFYTRLRGSSQRLPNGNTLIVDSDGGEAFEVTPGQEVVWSCSCGVELKRARRYTPEQLPFLNAEQRARP